MISIKKNGMPEMYEILYNEWSEWFVWTPAHTHTHTLGSRAAIYAIFYYYCAHNDIRQSPCGNIM